MRTITGNIKILADEKYANKKLEFILCNLYGKQISNLDVDGQIATKKSITTDEEGNFKIELFETETSKIPMYYKIIFIDNPDIEDIKLFVQEGSDSINFLKLLFPLPKLNMFYENKNQKVIFHDMIVGLFDRYFTNEDIFINLNEKNLIDEYLRYADNIRDSELMEKLDKYLGEIKWAIKIKNIAL